MAHAFDLILSEYAGYTDDSILDLPMPRIRQMVEVISERRLIERNLEQKFQVRLAEMQTQMILAQLSNLAMTKEAGKAMRANVAKVSFLPTDDEKKKEETVPSTREVATVFGVRRDGLIGVKS